MAFDGVIYEIVDGLPSVFVTIDDLTGKPQLVASLDCGCCPVSDCLLYPAFSPFEEPPYTADDLPDAIEVKSIHGVEVIAIDTDGLGGRLRSYTGSSYYVVETEGIESDWSIIGDMEGIPTILDYSRSLIFRHSDESYIKDQFASSYLAGFSIYGAPESAVLERTSLCVWEGTSSSGLFIRVYYDDLFTFKWYAKWVKEGCGEEDAAFHVNPDLSDANQSTPTGAYNGAALHCPEDPEGEEFFSGYFTFS